MGGAFCSGKGISFHTTQDSTAIRLDKADDSFGPGYTATLIAKEASERVEGTVCGQENCIRQALEESVEGNSVGGGNVGKKGKRRDKFNPKNRNKNITLIEIDSDFLLLNAPIVVQPLTTVHIQPKAPRTSVVLDGGKKIPIVIAGKNSHVQFRNIHFSHGFRQGKGGALVSGGTVDIKDCSFIDNTSEEGGGAIGLEHGAGESVITRSYFSGNHAKKGSGGAIYVEKHRLAIHTENIFADNQCSETGSVLFASKAELSVSGGTYENNRGEHVYAAKGTVFNVAN
jgi:predicted outer membrane repeat protein